MFLSEPTKATLHYVVAFLKNVVTKLLRDFCYKNLYVNVK